jgi:hypothetical protein
MFEKSFWLSEIGGKAKLLAIGLVKISSVKIQCLKNFSNLCEPSNAEGLAEPPRGAGMLAEPLPEFNFVPS